MGAAAERGDDLASCAEIGERVNAASGSMGVALSSCIVPAAGSPTFSLGEGEIEVGIGIHGEPGRRRDKIKPADEIVAELIEAILAYSPSFDSVDLLAIVNGMGGTPLIELYLVFDSVVRQCQQRGLTVSRSLVGNYCTSLEMQGCSVTLVALDPELKELWDAPVRTATLRVGVG